MLKEIITVRQQRNLNFPKIFISILICFLFSVPVFCQDKAADIALLRKKDFSNPKLEYKRQIEFGISASKHSIGRYNPITYTFSLLMFGYQRYLSPQISADCMYRPTCSEYGRQLFRRFGFFKGLVTTADRLLRCDRISATTINPVSVDPIDGRIHETTDRYVFKSSSDPNEY
jgi:uncharacterized protein